jgi:hypothetical protein
LRFREVVELSNEEVVEICGRLALAHRAISREPESRAAFELVWVFDLLERRMVR